MKSKSKKNRSHTRVIPKLRKYIIPHLPTNNIHKPIRGTSILDPKKDTLLNQKEDRSL